MIFQFIIDVCPSSFKYQEYLDKAIWFFNVGFLNDWRWLKYINFTFKLVIPMCAFSLGLFHEILAWYMILFRLHLFPRVHSVFMLQLLDCFKLSLKDLPLQTVYMVGVIYGRKIMKASPTYKCKNKLNLTEGPSVQFWIQLRETGPKDSLHWLNRYCQI